MRVTTVCAAVVAALALSACGSNAEPEPAASATSEDAPSTPAPTKTEPTVDPQKLADFKTCGRELSPLLRSLQNLDSRLNIGLVNADYGTALGDVQVAYDRTDFGNLGEGYGCLTVAIGLEGALNEYIKASTRWDDCIGDYGCDVDTEALPKLRERWSKATTLIGKAEKNLAKLDPR